MRGVSSEVKTEIRLSKDDFLSCVRKNLMLPEKIPGRIAPQ
jgi:hypothetical protein